MGCVAHAQEVAPKPNILVILADDLGFADVGFNGSQDIPTPHIDALAKAGVRFESGYVTHPYCSPSRAALMAGRYQQRFGHECNPEGATSDNDEGIATSEILLPAILQTAGYVSGLVGKWHLGVAKKFHPLNRGFDEFYGFLGGGFNYFGKPGRNGASVLRGFEPVDPKTITYLTDRFAEEAADFIRRHRDRPWFLYLAFNAPHAPDQATPKYLERFPTLKGGRKTYAAMVSALDDGVGRVMAELRVQGLETRTLVFFLSDNGGRADWADNRPLKGHKGNTYEGGIRVPFAAAWPGHLTPGTIYHEPVSALDIHATALALAGVTGTPQAHTEGVNLIPYLTGAQRGVPHQTLFWRVCGGWDYAVRDGAGKLVKPGWREVSELYDLAEDSHEQHDLAGREGERRAQLQALYEKWNAGNVPPLWEDPHKANVARERERETWEAAR